MKEYLNEQGYWHRTDGPAVTHADGGEEWWFNGNKHRADGPAVIGPDGYTVWYKHGKRHRVDGPAVTWSNGVEQWWVNGVQLDEFAIWVLSNTKEVK